MISFSDEKLRNFNKVQKQQILFLSFHGTNLPKLHKSSFILFLFIRIHVDKTELDIRIKRKKCRQKNKKSVRKLLDDKEGLGEFNMF